MEISVFAKLNLCLAVTGKKNGMHSLDGIMTETFLSDRVFMEKTDSECSVEYTDGRAYANDTAYKAALTIKEKYHTGGIRVLIEKSIPEGAGLGGSSVDAAAVCRGMNEFYELNGIDNNVMAAIGSDVPYCYYGGNKRVSGFGEVITDVDLPKLYQVILIPKGRVNTGECYALYDKIGGKNPDVEKFLKEIKNGLPNCENALFDAASTLNGEIGEGFKLLEKAGFCAGMTGSGSAVFGLERDKEEFFRKLNILKKYASEEKFGIYAQKE